MINYTAIINEVRSNFKKKKKKYKNTIRRIHNTRDEATTPLIETGKTQGRVSRGAVASPRLPGDWLKYPRNQLFYNR